MKVRLFLVLLSMLSVAAVAQNSAKPAASAKAALPYAIQVERVDSKVDGVPAEFSAAIYENLVEVLSKSGRYQQVFRSGDKRAAGVADLLTLKTTVSKFQEGSETKRAVTTVSGATQVFVHMQATAPDGHAVAEKDVDGAVHFFGTNLRATHTLAVNMEKQLAAALGASAKK